MPFATKKCISGSKEIAAHDKHHKKIREAERNKNRGTCDGEMQFKKANGKRDKWGQGRLQSISSESFFEKLEDCREKLYGDLEELCEKALAERKAKQAELEAAKQAELEAKQRKSGTMSLHDWRVAMNRFATKFGGRFS